ncbi:prepilin-type N-terminal cleavage/methylation domain-containing protein [Aeromonas media]|uniref:prepilin-type N-terminal cleavage/methylation domain-containing protein n=1 Tax=Aeromonas media TaxID=651 RepID=UPI003D1F8F22
MFLRHNQGFNLVELMVAMVAGLLLVAAASALFASILKANKTAMQVSRLNQELQSTADMMARDIQRAGYDASAATNTLLYNPTSGSSTTLFPFAFKSADDLESNCIRVRYDDNENGALDNTSAAGETRRYKYNSAEKVVRLAQGDEGEVVCSQDEGDKISTDNTIAISALSFSMISGSVSTGVRTIRLTITGNDVKSPALALTLQRDIKLRNDGFSP